MKQKNFKISFRWRGSIALNPVDESRDGRDDRIVIKYT